MSIGGMPDAVQSESRLELLDKPHQRRCGWVVGQHYCGHWLERHIALLDGDRGQVLTHCCAVSSWSLVAPRSEVVWWCGEMGRRVCDGKECQRWG
jgi:hypothetical protein